MRTTGRVAARRVVPHPAVREVLVHLVGDVQEVVFGAERVDGAQGRFRVHGAGGVVGRDGHDGARPRRDRRAHGLEIELVALVGRHRHRTAPDHRQRHLVVEVERHGQDDLVARVGHGQHGVQEGHVAARGHDHAAPLQRQAVLARDLVAQDREQVRLSLDGAVPVVGQLSAERLHGLHDLGRGPVRHHPLAERDRPRVGADPLAEDGNDRGLDVGDAAREVHVRT